MGSERLKSHLFEVVHGLLTMHSLADLLRASQLSRSGYYKWRLRLGNCTHSINEDLKSKIRAIHALRPIYGYRRMTTTLRRQGIHVNHKRIYRLMKQLGYQSTIRKRRKYFGRKGSCMFPNVLRRDFKSQNGYQKLVTDITFLPVDTGFLYLSAVQDLHNNEIISYEIGKRNTLDLVLKTVAPLKAVISNDTVLHSDQGFQYTSKLYKQTLDDAGIQGSHSRKGNCLDNACIESFFSHLKTEAFPTGCILSERDTIVRVHEYINFYNTERFQKRLGQLSPVEFREKLAV